MAAFVVSMIPEVMSNPDKKGDLPFGSQCCDGHIELNFFAQMQDMGLVNCIKHFKLSALCVERWATSRPMNFAVLLFYAEQASHNEYPRPKGRSVLGQPTAKIPSIL